MHKTARNSRRDAKMNVTVAVCRNTLCTSLYVFSGTRAPNETEAGDHPQTAARRPSHQAVPGLTKNWVKAAKRRRLPIAPVIKAIRKRRRDTRLS